MVKGVLVFLWCFFIYNNQVCREALLDFQFLMYNKITYMLSG
jgi:hypothetical protein